MSLPVDVAVLNTIGPVAERYETRPLHWLTDENGEDLCITVCPDCGNREVKEHPGYTLDGGCLSDNDGPAFCEGCGVPLDVTYTECAVAQELDHFEVNGFDKTDPGDAWSLCRMLGATVMDGNTDNAVRIKALIRRAGLL